MPAYTLADLLPLERVLTSEFTIVVCYKIKAIPFRMIDLRLPHRECNMAEQFDVLISRKQLLCHGSRTINPLFSCLPLNQPSHEHGKVVQTRLRQFIKKTIDRRC